MSAWCHVYQMQMTCSESWQLRSILWWGVLMQTHMYCMNVDFSKKLMWDHYYSKSTIIGFPCNLCCYTRVKKFQKWHNVTSRFQNAASRRQIEVSQMSRHLTSLVHHKYKNVSIMVSIISVENNLYNKETASQNSGFGLDTGTTKFWKDMNAPSMLFSSLPLLITQVIYVNKTIAIEGWRPCRND